MNKNLMPIFSIKFAENCLTNITEFVNSFRYGAENLEITNDNPLKIYDLRLLRMLKFTVMFNVFCTLLWFILFLLQDILRQYRNNIVFLIPYKVRTNTQTVRNLKIPFTTYVA